MNQLYGKEVTVRTIFYKAGKVPLYDGSYMENEGFLVELITDDPKLEQVFQTVQNQTFHISGSYQDKQKYTNEMDFSDGEPVSYTFTGTFGSFMADGKILLHSKDAEQHSVNPDPV